MQKRSLPTLLQFSLLVLASLFFQSASAQQKLNPAIEARISALLKQMTIQEKVGQMAQVSVESLGSSQDGSFRFSDKMKDAVVNYGVGSILNTPGPLQNVQDWNRIVTEIQNMARTTRLKIPVLYGLDHIHGVSYIGGGTLFPQPIGQAATFNPALAHEAGVITAYESRAAGVPWTFSPALDLGVNPMWPRIWEGYGEDPYLISAMGTAFVKGVQDPLGDRNKLVVSLKHYMAYSDPKSGNDRTDAWIPEHYLREYHLTPFIAAVKAGARTVMVNSALINGIPTHINKHLLTDILKNELGFSGFVVTDWQDIENIYRRDHVVNDIKEAIALAINAGNDMSMIPYDYKGFTSDLLALVREGKVSNARIDDAVRRILRVKMETGILEKPTTQLSDYPNFGSEAFALQAYQTAAESITLLKNANGILPLRKGSKILVTGANANSMRTLNGGWTYTWQGERTDQYGEKYHTILEAVQAEFGKENVSYSPGVSYKPQGMFYEDTLVDVPAAVQAAAAADYILLCLGENSYTETPGNLAELTLSENQMQLALQLYATGKPVILVLNEGRPRVIRKIEPGAAAILDIYLPGNYGADALADILSGEVNPSGKLPITYPRFTNSLTNYIHKPSEGGSNPQGGAFNPQYEFGFGLSYTRFGYSNLSINKNNLGPNESISVSVTVQNMGNREGKEVVQVYISDLVASFTPDVKRLRAFEKISLAPGESRVVSFNIPLKELGLVGPDLKKHLEAGEFKVSIGGHSLSFHLNQSLTY